MRKVILSGMVGNVLEWYDFALYGYFATIISQQFFPGGDAYVSLIAAYGAFAAGFLMRPVGAILFGIIGDRFGRKAALAVAILMMAIPTACIGLLPTYAQIGLWAPVLLTVIRLCQGLSLGGEFSGSITFIVEHSSDRHRGLAGSTTMVGLVGGMLLGSVVASATAGLMEPAELERWGWRVPFLVGLAVGLVGFYIRHCTEESPKYTHTKAAGGLSPTPVREALTGHTKAMAQGVGIYLAVTVPFYTATVFLITYYAKILGNPLEDALTLNSVMMVVMMGAMLASGWLSDKVGRKRIMITAAVGYVLLLYPIFWMMGAGSFALAMAAQIVMALLVGAYVGPVPAVLVELFPTRVRYSGMAIAYNVSAALFGGTSPMVATWLIKATGQPTAVAGYVMLFALASLVTLYFYRDRYGEEIE
ncbi:MAG: MFS transporter [Alphaproteobacteria bacterium]|nr:MFS transporter [Alphaproteobacteria bacterium]